MVRAQGLWSIGLRSLGIEVVFRPGLAPSASPAFTNRFGVYEFGVQGLGFKWFGSIAARF